jgi:hypothetical protein
VKPDGEDATNNVNEGAAFAKDGDTRVVNFMRALDTGDADEDAVFKCEAKRTDTEHMWFTRT